MRIRPMAQRARPSIRRRYSIKVKSGLVIFFGVYVLNIEVVEEGVAAARELVVEEVVGERVENSADGCVAVRRGVQKFLHKVECLVRIEFYELAVDNVLDVDFRLYLVVNEYVVDEADYGDTVPLGITRGVVEMWIWHDYRVLELVEVVVDVGDEEERGGGVVVIAHSLTEHVGGVFVGG